MSTMPHIHAVIGPTASGKSARAISLAKELNGEVISVDSRQVYRMLDIGTEKITQEEMDGIPHHLIDIRDPKEFYSAGEFVKDAEKTIREIHARDKTAILAGGTHFYLDALLYNLPVHTPTDMAFREVLEAKSASELYSMLLEADPRRAASIDKENPRRLIRALEIIAHDGPVPEREKGTMRYDVTWTILDPERDTLRTRIEKRLIGAFERGLVNEVSRVRAHVGDARLHELGLEYRIIGEYLRGERTEESLLPTLVVKLWHYARHQKSWIRKLSREMNIPTTEA